MTLATKLLGAAPKRDYFVAIAHATSPYVTVYPWDSATGFGAKLSNPGTALSSQANSVAFHPSGLAIAVGHGGSSPRFSVYAFSTSGWGSKYSDPASTPATTVNSVAFSPDGTWLIAADNNGNVCVYPFDLSTGIGAKVASSPSVGSAVYEVFWHPAGAYFSVAMANSPYARIYPFSGGVVGSAINPGSNPSGFGNAAPFSPSGDAIAVANGGSNYITGYPFSAGAFGTKFTNPGSMPSSTCYYAAFSGNGAYVAIGSFSSPYVYAYQWSDSTGYGTKISDPAGPDLPPGTVSGVVFSHLGDALFFAANTSPYIGAYAWNGSFGSRYSNPATLPTGVGYTVAVGRI